MNKLIKKNLPLIWVLYFIVLISTISILIIIYFPVFNLSISPWRKELITAVISSCLFGGFIAAAFFYLSDIKSYKLESGRVKSEIENYLIPDLKLAIQEGITKWDLFSKEMYLDRLLARPFYKIWNRYRKTISGYLIFYPSDMLIATFNKLNEDTQIMFVNMLDIERVIRAKVREENHKDDVDDFNDRHYVAYIKGKIFAGLSDAELLPYLQVPWKSIPDRASKMAINLQADLKEVIDAFNKFRNDYEKFQDEIISELEGR